MREHCTVNCMVLPLCSWIGVCVGLLIQKEVCAAGDSGRNGYNSNRMRSQRLAHATTLSDCLSLTLSSSLSLSLYAF